MNRAFGLTVILIGVIAAIFYLRREAAPPDGADGGTLGASRPRAAAPDGGRRRPKMRVVALTRLVPRYTLAIPAADPREARRRYLHWLKQRGGKAVGPLPADPRAAFDTEVPAGSFKQLLKDLGMARGGLRLRSRPARPATGPAPIEIRVSFPTR